MAYQVPPRWSHSDLPTAAEFNKYSDGLDHLESVLGLGLQMASRQRQTGETFFLVRAWRWLHYRSVVSETATIVDPSGVGSPVSLPNSTSAIVAYDLESVGWLFQGQVYQVTGADVAVEDFQP
jgi:hypothetical protein